MEEGVNRFRLQVPIAVRFRDIDSFGHVNNAVYFTYCEIARNAYWKKLFGTRRLAEANFIVARAEMNYRGQAMEENPLLVGIRIATIGRTSFDFEYRLIEDVSQRLIAEGRSVQVTFDYKANHKVPMPDAVRDRILAFEGLDNVEQKGVYGG